MTSASQLLSLVLFAQNEYQRGCFNTACRGLYERIVAKGKRKKLALLAVCNKLLRQAFAIAKSALIYDVEYKSPLVKN